MNAALGYIPINQSDAGEASSLRYGTGEVAITQIRLGFLEVGVHWEVKAQNSDVKIL